MILIDTSVWVEHLRRRSADLIALLNDGLVTCHPFVIGELALGAMTRRSEILDFLHALPAARVVEHEEALAMVDEHGLFARGVGWVDIHLLASARLDRLQLWTLDRRLMSVARALNVGRED